jgi:hypothetical protein
MKGRAAGGTDLEPYGGCSAQVGTGRSACPPTARPVKLDLTTDPGGGIVRAEPRCVIDRSRACGGCIAPNPRECPYAYLLDPAELAAVVAAGARARPLREGPVAGSS